jgi:hypothetical protein
MWCGLASAAPSSQFGGSECAALKKETGDKEFKTLFRDQDWRHAMQNCRAQSG